MILQVVDSEVFNLHLYDISSFYQFCNNHLQINMCGRETTMRIDHSYQGATQSIQNTITNILVLHATLYHKTRNILLILKQINFKKMYHQFCNGRPICQSMWPGSQGGDVALLSLACKALNAFWQDQHDGKMFPCKTLPCCIFLSPMQNALICLCYMTPNFFHNIAPHEHPLAKCFPSVQPTALRTNILVNHDCPTCSSDL